MAAEVKAAFEGAWTVVRDENLVAFLDKKGLGVIKRKIASTVKPTLTIAVDGDTISVSLSMGPITNKAAFKLGEECDVPEEKAKLLSTWSEGKMTSVITPNDPKEKPMTVVREIIDGELVQTMTLDGVTCKRIFKKK